MVWLKIKTNGLVLITGNPAIQRKAGPVAFRPMVTHGLALEEATRLSSSAGPVAFRPTVTRGLAVT
jgi:hypothetical protein